MTQAVDNKSLFAAYDSANTRLILLDYDGTLVPFDLHPKLTSPYADVKAVVKELARDTRNHVVIISGRDKEHLESVWRKVPVTLVAEHGGYYKNPTGTWQPMFSVSLGWLAKVLPALNALSFHYEGSFVEQKTYSIAWHYRAIAGRISDIDRKQIVAAIRALPEYEQFLIYDGDYTIELRTPGIDKGSFLARWTGSRYFDFVMAIGDGQTDEDLFRFLRENAWTIRVGKPEQSAANFYIDSQASVIPLLKSLSGFELEAENRVRAVNG